MIYIDRWDGGSIIRTKFYSASDFTTYSDSTRRNPT
uniref:Uncharacterized protein n=1 Tax=Arundo donax TaxID=35708 RepID=A0A0A9B1S3_ARUDO